MKKALETEEITTVLLLSCSEPNSLRRPRARLRLLEATVYYVVVVADGGDVRMFRAKQSWAQITSLLPPYFSVILASPTLPVWEGMGS